MACYNQLLAYQKTDRNLNGKRPVTFSKSEAFEHNKLYLPCGKCLGCRLEYARQYAVRCVHEAQLHEHNCFITLTYRPEDIPEDRSVHKTHIQKFIKRLRRKIGKQISYFAAGEYGEKGWKPHYHLIIFGYDFPDKTLWGNSPLGLPLYISEELRKLWKHGYHSIGNVTIESASYVARYCMKKIDIATNDDGTIPLTDTETGEYYLLKPEFTLMSKNPAIAKNWIEIYWKDVYPKDFITIEGTRHKPPKYYDRWLEKNHPEIYEKVMEERKDYVINNQDNTVARQYVKEKVKTAQTQTLKRNLEE